MLIDPISVTVTRFGPGGHIGGQWADGSDSTLTIEADVQPLNARDLMNVPEGQREAGWIKLYSETLLRTVDDVQGCRADVVAYKGRRWEVQKVTTWEAIGLDHFKAECRLITEVVQL